MANTNFVWDYVNDCYLAEVDDSGNATAVYTCAPVEYGKVISQNRSGTTRYYHHDAQGSSVALTDQNAQVTDEYTYNAFGETVASNGTTSNPFRYSGKYGYYTDFLTNEIYVRARTYKPSHGRWCSKDSKGFVDGTNLFRAYFIPNGLDPGGTDNLWNPFTWGSGVNSTWGYFSLPREGYHGFGTSYSVYVNPWGNSGPPPIDWIDSGLTFGTQLGQGTAVVAGGAAIGILAWGAAGGAVFGVSFTPAVSSGYNVTFQVAGQWIRGTTTGLVRLPSGPGWGGFTPGYWTTITGIPIINPAAAGAVTIPWWFPNNPCASAAIQSFINGWIPWR